jgi:SAM-dependent methyltransferase
VDDDSLLETKRELTDRYGPWTAHNIQLGSVQTIGPDPSGDEVKLRRVVQVLSDLFQGEFDGLRALDLACLEGMYGLELARRGADVVAIEGRDANLEKARFAANALELDQVEFILGDVRSLSRERHGSFDVVLCLGILYHLDVPDVFAFVEQMAEVCTRVLVVDTHVALEASETHTHDGEEYQGHGRAEHDPGSQQSDRVKVLWASLDNPRSFWPTRASLLRMLAHVGFTSVFEVHVPAEPDKRPNRVTLVALKGTPQLPLITAAPAEDATAVPEQQVTTVHRTLPTRVLGRLRRLAGKPG